MVIRRSIPAIAICDGCGADGETVEVRKPKSGALSHASLPEHWVTIRDGAEQFHLCGPCVSHPGGPFGDRRSSFDARMDHHGFGMLPSIAASLSLPAGIAERWAAEWQSQQRRVA